ncbi:MAG: 16S rRNA (uracil(1498)-N(3))-methyltransferase [Verrucomicrobia bacterium]|nr:16S rRNA (uracil(1498)-N(3))-methyltransferase [Verrucomicrobiota bacterium]
MHRFYLPPDQCRDSVLQLSAADGHHAREVLRVRLGDRAAVLDGVGAELLCEVREVSSRAVSLAVLQRHSQPPLAWQVTLLQAVPRGKTMETIVQKATELGVFRIVPLLSERTTVRLAEGEWSRKADKWRLTAIEAIKQCGSPWLPQIATPASPREVLQRGEKFELSLIASLQRDSRHPRECFEAFTAEQQRSPKSIGVWVGPEGDFTPAELSAAKGAGAWPISLGPLILRSDTAAVYCLSVINYELQATASGRASSQ